MPAHYFNNKKTVMRVGCIPNFINSAGYADTWYSKFLAQFISTGKASVSTNYYQSVNTSFCQIFESFFSSFFAVKFFAACSFQDSSTALNNISNRAGIHLNYIIFNHSIVSSVNTKYVQSII